MTEYDYIGEFKKIYRKWIFEYNKAFEDLHISSDEGSEMLSLLQYFNNIAELVYHNRIKIEDDTFLHLNNAFSTLVDYMQSYYKSKSVGALNNTTGLLKARKEDLLKITLPLEKWLNKDLNNNHKTTQEILELLEKSKGLHENIESILKKSNTELESLETSVKPLLKTLNIANYKDDFSTIAEENKSEARKWFWGISISIIFFIIFLRCFILSGFEFDNINNTVEQNTELLGKGLGKTLFYLEIAKAVFYRLIVLSLCTFLIKICYANYKAAKHNAVINQHKDNSLKGALGLINSAKDEKVRDYILQLAANAVFAHQPSGYNDKNIENNNYTNIIETLTDKAKEKI